MIVFPSQDHTAPRSGRITEEYWVERFNGWQEELAIVRAEIRDLENATFNSFKKADALLELCRRAPDLYRRQTPDEQARLMKLVTSNFSWDGVTLTPRYRKPFDQLAEGLLFMDGGAHEIQTKGGKECRVGSGPSIS